MNSIILPDPQLEEEEEKLKRKEKRIENKSKKEEIVEVMDAEGESEFNIPQKHSMEREEEYAPKKQKGGFKSSFGRRKF
jgi:hypothetical protein